MTIKFLVTGVAWKPLGGLKMIYEYASRLANDGHDVHIYYGICSLIGNNGIKARLKAIGKYAYFRMGISDWKCSSWYKLSSSVKEHLVWKLSPGMVGTADRYIATTLGSAYWLAQYPETKGVKKLYFIQDFESWGNGITNDTVYNSFRFPLRKIVIAQWLRQRVKQVDEDSTVVVNGFDFNRFNIFRSIESRHPATVIMMYNQKKTKGCHDSFEALAIVKDAIPELEVAVFGIPERPSFLPAWYNYTCRPTPKQLVELYNNAAIYVGASHTEGWGLTIGEAMACGCAVACTDNDGYLEMAHDGDTALVSPIKAPKALAENIMQLITDNHLRHAIAKRGHEFILGMSIEDSYRTFKNCVEC